MTVLQTGQMLFVYSRKTSSRSTFCRSGVIVMAEPSCARRAANRRRTYFGHTSLRRPADEQSRPRLSDRFGHLVAVRPGAAVGRDGAWRVLGATPAQPHEP